MVTLNEIINLTNRAKKLAVALYKDKVSEGDFNTIQIYDNGEIYAVFVGYNHGGWEESFELTLPDIYDDIDIVIEKHNKIKQEKEQKKREEEKEAKKLKDQEKEANDLALYNKLKEKFEKH